MGCIPGRIVDGTNSVITLAAVIWSIVIYGMNKGSYPSCDKEHLEKWFIIYGVCGIAIVPFLLAYSIIAVRLQAKAGSYLAAACFSLLYGLFLFAWWICGNVWIWNGSEVLCGDLVSRGKELLIFQYCGMGLNVIMGCCRAPPPAKQGEGVLEGASEVEGDPTRALAADITQTTS
eukprot:PhF_6_TR612/c0_g1_i1/m.788